MNYEYKEEILLDIGPEPNCNYESESNKHYDKIDELEHVYAQAEQAAKADEYEAKAKAWDKYKAHMESHIAGEINEEELVSDLKSDYFEIDSNIDEEEESK